MISKNEILSKKIGHSKKKHFSTRKKCVYTQKYRMTMDFADALIKEGISDNQIIIISTDARYVFFMDGF